MPLPSCTAQEHWAVCAQCSEIHSPGLSSSLSASVLRLVLGPQPIVSRPRVLTVGGSGVRCYSLQ